MFEPVLSLVNSIGGAVLAVLLQMESIRLFPYLEFAKPTLEIGAGHWLLSSVAMEVFE